MELFAQPWWVNLLVLVPIAAYLSWRTSLHLPLNLLGALTLWSIAFGFLEATVVVYLRAIIGVLAGYDATFSAIARLSANLGQQPFVTLSRDLSVVEVWREGATMIMLLGVSILSSKGWRERSACFLWAFGVWDISYYLALRIMIGWPTSLTTPDVLFLIPRPWMAQIWFPLLVSSLTIVAVMISRSPVGKLKRLEKLIPPAKESPAEAG